MIIALLLAIAFLGFLALFLGLVTLGMTFVMFHIVDRAVLASEKTQKADLDSRIFALCDQWKSEISSIKNSQSPIPGNPFYVAEKDADITKRSIIAQADAAPESQGWRGAGMSAGAGGI